MKVAPKVIVIFDDVDGGFATALLDGLHPNPNSPLQTSKESFDLSLDRYGIKDYKASGNITHFVDDHGVPQVSILVLQKYQSPVLACAISEVLSSLAGEDTSPLLILPFILEGSKIKLGRESADEGIYGIQVGPQTGMMQALVSRIPKAPSSMQIHHEPLSCVLQLVRVLKTPTFILIGQLGQHKASGDGPDGLEVIREMGETLASAASLRFVKEKVTWNPTKASKETEKEPWRALYG